jgi:hypothetical protein
MAGERTKSLETHYTCRELAKRWHFDASTIRSWCNKHGGVLVIDHPETMHKRAYRTIRIPQSTADEMYRLHFLPKQGGRERDFEYPIVVHQPINVTSPKCAPTAAFSALDDKILLPDPNSIEIFTQHDRGCKYWGIENHRTCDCPKSFRIMDSVFGLRTSRSGTRSWGQAEIMRREVVYISQRSGEQVLFVISRVRSRWLLNLTQAAYHAGRTKEEIQAMIDQGRLPATRFGKNVFVHRTDLAAIGVGIPTIQ